MVVVKICGITNERDIGVCVDAGADFIGFIVGVPSSPRNLSLPKARSLISKVPNNLRSVVVTVYTNTKNLLRFYSQLYPDYIQLHGNLHSFLTSECKLSPREYMIGAVNATKRDAFNLAVEYSAKFESILLDSATDDKLGGTGLPHKWSLSRRIRDEIYPTPLILAGGLNPQNVDEAIRKVKPYGVDVSTGVEVKPGIKDNVKIFDFVKKAKEMRL